MKYTSHVPLGMISMEISFSILPCEIFMPNYLMLYNLYLPSLWFYRWHLPMLNSTWLIDSTYSWLIDSTYICVGWISPLPVQHLSCISYTYGGSAEIFRSSILHFGNEKWNYHVMHCFLVAGEEVPFEDGDLSDNRKIAFESNMSTCYDWSSLDFIHLKSLLANKLMK